jgi:hypothetical protein
LFREGTLPEGWTKVRDPKSSYYTYLLDERGIQRVDIFHKATFYDRDAFMTLLNVGRQIGLCGVWNPDTFDESQVNLLTSEERTDFISYLQEQVNDDYLQKKRPETWERAKALTDKYC